LQTDVAKLLKNSLVFQQFISIKLNLTVITI